MQLLSQTTLFVSLWILTFRALIVHCSRHPPERDHPARLLRDHLDSPARRIVDPSPTEKMHDGRPEVTIQDYNVYVDGTKISNDGNESCPYAIYDEIYVSQDGKFAVVYHYSTPDQNRTVTLVESSPREQLQPKFHQNWYDKPGDTLALQKPRLFDLEKKEEVKGVGPEDWYPNPFGLFDASWSNDGKTYRFVYNERGHKLVRMLEMDRTGKVRLLVEETEKKFIDWTNKIQWAFFNTTDMFWWTSERDRHNHVYLYNSTTGDLIRQVTKGDWEVYNVEWVDEKKGVMWVRGFGMIKGQDPYYMHLAKVNLDGTGFEVLTKDIDAYHRFTWVENYTQIEDRYSRIDMPMKGVLRDLDEKILGDLDSELMTGLMDNVTLSTIEMFNYTARDATTWIGGTIIRPRDFDPSKKYPVLEYVYAGPQDRYVIRELGASDQKALSYFQKQADDLQVVVVQVDGMGTNWRGKDFHEVCYQNLKDAGFPDRIRWIKAAAKDRPWMNLDMVAIYGTSAGGQNALGGLLWWGDFYKAAIADAGCHDNRMDKIWWNEQWMSWPVDNTYAASSNVVHAGRLKGKLLLLVGELDTNVDPSSTLQVVNALNDAGKDYQLLWVPGAGHGIMRPGWTDVPNVQTLVNKFWKDWLAGA